MAKQDTHISTTPSYPLSNNPEEQLQIDASAYRRDKYPGRRSHYDSQEDSFAHSFQTESSPALQDPSFSNNSVALESTNSSLHKAKHAYQEVFSESTPLTEISAIPYGRHARTSNLGKHVKITEELIDELSFTNEAIDITVVDSAYHQPTSAENTPPLNQTLEEGSQEITLASEEQIGPENNPEDNIKENEVSNSQNPSVTKSMLLMSVATLGSRITGLLRTWVMAFVLGNTLITSAYQVANNLPNVVFELVAGGLLAAAFVPVYMLQKEKLGTEKGNEFACTILNLSIIVLGVLSIIATILAPQVVSTQTFTVTNKAEVSQYAIAFFRIFAVQILFYGIGGVITGILNANRIFFLPALAPAINNVVVILSFIAYFFVVPSDPRLALILLAAGTSLGVAVQFIVQIPALKSISFHWTPKINLHDPALIEAVKIAIPTFIYIAGTMVAFTYRNAFSLQAGYNGPSTLNYAWTWYQLPYGIIAVSLSRALFTELSESAAQGKWTLFKDHVNTGIATTLLLIIPLAGLMIVCSQPIIQLFRAGAFNAEDVNYVASILALWTLSLPFYSVHMYLYNVFAAMRKYLQFAIVSTVMVVVQCLCYALFCNPDLFRLYGVPIADFIYYACCCIIMLIVLTKQIGSFGLPSILWSTVRVLCASLVGMGLSKLLLNFISAFLPPASIIGGLIELGICGMTGLIVIFILCYLLKVPEMEFITSILGKFTSKLKRS